MSGIISGKIEQDLIQEFIKKRSISSKHYLFNYNENTITFLERNRIHRCYKYVWTVNWLEILRGNTKNASCERTEITSKNWYFTYGLRS